MMIGIGIVCTLTRKTGVLVPPAGYVFMIDTDGAYLVDTDGYYLVEPA